ncbi:phage portal protein [Corynebacterium heidelbergense]|uniref:Phage portal protein n=1 Tax=Corynebacterium heidelbergense TaxID=2055947 RepID=A0A364VA68_9CORY|nr:phage portal protein [Corynebacterium heidelbergense]RAV33539.1 hypothetical protein CWC39_08000 [Corynebacterium heidelbergense]WCZ36175.1 Phage portal protein [Corynebacterium heidelbergense]WCZ37630.1 Phage portal protein [Corynebacterium heidelbergense]
MGITDSLRQWLALPYLAAQPYDAVPYESPWASPNHLLTITPPDAPRPVSRAMAMGVPAIARARRLIVGAIARCPLEARQDGKRAVRQPLWMVRTDGVASPVFRMTWTVDDLFFYGWSCWALERDASGAVIRADRIPYHLWDVDQDNRVIVQGQIVDPSDVCLIPGPDEGLLQTSAAAIRHAVQLQELATRYAETPAAQVLLKQTGGQPLTDAQRRALVESWADARRGKNGGVAFANQSIDVQELGKANTDLLIGGRNAAAVDIARAAGVPAMMIDAGTAGTGTITYSNAAARNVELIDYALAPYMAAIAARLGLDDVVPRGTAVAFDLTDLTSPTVGDLDVPDDDKPDHDTPQENGNA